MVESQGRSRVVDVIITGLEYVSLYTRYEVNYVVHMRKFIHVIKTHILLLSIG